MKRKYLRMLALFIVVIAVVVGGVALVRALKAKPSASPTVSQAESVATLSPGTGIPPTSAPVQDTESPAAVTAIIAPTSDAGSSSQVPTTIPAQEAVDPFSLISLENLLAYLQDLTAIQSYSGWRNSASQGEVEALDYVATALRGFSYLQGLGLELERQSFRVYLATEIWESRLHLTIHGNEVEVPADALRGPRDEIAQALRFDSDGRLNDAERDPVSVEGPILVVRSADEISDLRPRRVRDRIVFLDYAAIDRVTVGDTATAVQIAWSLWEQEPAGVVLVTSFSNEPGQSHGTFVGDVSALNWVETDANPTVLYVRLEDLAPAGIASWEDLERIEAARLTWDADLFSPASSGNLVARIPGADPAQAMILGAHIDSPNAPGALDDGSGCVVLLEIARVLDAARVQPPVDLYLVWFGSEEMGLYGSAHFAATHQDLLDRSRAMLQIDMLSRPLDGIQAAISLVSWSYARLGDAQLPWPDHLARVAARRGVETVFEDVHAIYSDNSSFSGFDVPNADMIYQDAEAMTATGSLHYAAHVHDPYDTVELAREVGDVLEQMVSVALAGVLEPPGDLDAVRVTPNREHRALFVGSHTESAHMAPTAMIDLGMALAWEGFDVDMIPYGQAVTAADLAGTDMVIVLPVLDYPSSEGDVDQYDEAWSESEIDALERYVAEGGMLVVTNSAHRLKYNNRVLDFNEDWSDANALASRFGVVYLEGVLSGSTAQVEGESFLVDGVTVLELIGGNGVPFGLANPGAGQVLARAGGEPAVALVEHGQGHVLVLADLGLLGADSSGPDNLRFWHQVAQYAQK